MATLGQDTGSATYAAGTAPGQAAPVAAPAGSTEMLRQFVGERILPEFSPSIPLQVAYRTKPADNGAVLLQEDTKNEPTITFRGEEGKQYMLMMFDPDAPAPDHPRMRSWMHWAIMDIPPTAAIYSGEQVVPYAAPSPPSGRHRYIFLLLEQPAVTAFKAAVHGTLSAHMNRGGFDAAKFITDTGLRPVGMNYFCCDAPAGFVGKAGNAARVVGGLFGLK